MVERAPNFGFETSNIRTPLRVALSEHVGNVGKYILKRYNSGLDSVQLAVEVGELCGIQPTPEAVRHMIKAAGGQCRSPRERASIDHAWTGEAIKKRNKVMRSPRMKQLQSEKMKKYWRRRKYKEYVAQYGSPFAAITASKTD